MDTVYLVSMIVGGFFVLLSIFGGEMEHHVDVSSDVHGDFGGATAHDSDTGGGGFVDLLSLRTLFFFLAFFGLTGSLLSWTGSSETLTAITATVVGLVVGLGGNFAIQRIGHARVSSEITSNDLTGLTGRSESWSRATNSACRPAPSMSNRLNRSKPAMKWWSSRATASLSKS